MVVERTGEKQMSQPGAAQRFSSKKGDQSLPDFLEPEHGGPFSQANVTEIKTLLARSPEADDAALPDEDVDLAADDDEPRPKVKQSRTQLFGLVLLVVCLGAIGVGAVMVSGNEAWMKDLDCFLFSDIQKCKMAKVEALRTQWAKEDEATTPRYGDVTLTYFPQDAKVTITQTIKHQQGFEGPIASTEDVLIPNKSTELKENEIIEQLPLVDLPILERERNEDGGIKEVRHYTYKIKIERDGYEPREWTFEPSDWQRLGPEVNWSIPWQGADLVPKPETVKEPFAKAMREIYCLEQYYEKTGKKAGMTDADMSGQRKEIEIRHGFKTTADFESFSTMLRADEAWWAPVWEGIQKEKCPEPESQP